MLENNMKTAAVLTTNACFAYSSSSDLILDHIQVTVPKASIYGLLGPSGCGKTTLLKCILGRLKPNSGDITIFGSKPGSAECDIPGPGVGYMPQELGLYFDFNIKEILTYFGRIYAMNKQDIIEKVCHLIELLQLPRMNKMIGKLSGGQQRRVSLGCALIHSPPLLILDEPTVGTDPILRQNIWLHLTSLCRSGMTIILTTHYIEEARTANVVAFMRFGRILAEDNPNLLMNKYLSPNLEEVFLKLCQIESNSKSQLTDDPGHSSHNSRTNIIDNDKTIDEKKCQSLVIDNNSSVYLKIKNETTEDFCTENLLTTVKSCKTDRKRRFFGKCWALFHKNFKRLSHNWGQLIFFIILPALQLALLLVSISDGPTDLNLAIFNEELINNVTHDWGKVFVNCIDNKTFNVNYYESRDEAIDSVKSGLNYAFIDINDRFSKALKLRHIYGTAADAETVFDSQIDCRIDWSNQAIAVQIERHLYEAIQRFAEEVAHRADIDPEAVALPIRFESPVYGSRDESMRDFVIPGCYILLSFFSTASVTAHMILDERRDGLLERSLVAGVTAFEFLLSHALTQLLILCLQIVLMLLIPGLVFQRQIMNARSVCLPVLIALALSQGFCGIAFGLMISAICSDVIYAAMFTIFLFFVTIILGGVFWPIENMPFLLRQMSRVMPSTLPIESMRAILYRHWNADHFQVYIGFIVTYLWFISFIIIALIFLKRSL